MKNARKWLIGILISCATCIAAEQLLSNLYWNSPEPPGSYEERMKRDKALAALSEDNYDVVILGDSSAKEGFVPREFERATGLTSYNYAISAFVAPVADIYLLETYLENHAPPRGIVVGRSHEFWGTDPNDQHVRQNFERWDINLLLAINGLSSWSRLVEGVAASLIPSFQNRFYLQKYLRAADRTIWNRFITHPTPSLETDYGFTGQDRTISAEELSRLFDERREKLASNAYTPSKKNLVLLRYLCRIASREGIPIMVVSSYSIDVLANNPDYARPLQQATAIVANAARESGCSWHPPEAIGSEFMRNGTHPNLTGAILYTRRVASVVQQELAQ